MNTYAASDIAPRWATTRPATDRQFKYIGDLMKERGVSAEALRERFPAKPTSMKGASEVIEWLKAQPKAAPSRPPSPQYDGLAPKPKDGKKARAWHYALRDDVEGTVRFYRVKRGYKEGFYFVDVQASDDYYPIRNRAHREAILAAIAKDPQAALALYGQEVGACGRCGRTLTSEYRKLGIGPVCIDK